METLHFSLLLALGLVSSAAAGFDQIFAWGWVTNEQTAKAYAEIGVTDVIAHGTNACQIAHRYGLRAYCSYLPKDGPLQVFTPEETVRHRYQSGADLPKDLTAKERRARVDARMGELQSRFGGEPVAPIDFCVPHFPCILSDTNGVRACAQIDEILAKNPETDGIVFDGIGYSNLHSCECDCCKALLAEHLKRRGLAETPETRNAFYRAALVDRINMLVDHARKRRPGIRVALHLWPCFVPDPLYGRDLKADFIHETVAWYFQWPDEKIAAYTRQLVAEKALPGATRVPFVGLKASAEGALGHKSPERLEHELKLILANGGTCLSVCNGSDMILPDYREVFRKYARHAR